jgi:hypothetical protein
MMSHPTKKQRPEDSNDHAANDNAVLVTAGNLLASFGALSVDVLANIFGYLTAEEIMSKRRINKKSKKAAQITIVPFSAAPPADFIVDSLEKYNAVSVMTRALPNLQQIMFHNGLGNGHKYSDGEDPDEELGTNTADWTTHDIEIISNFSKLRVLDMYARLNGRYPFLFNSFPLLQILNIDDCYRLKWDLEMLAGFPLLKELHCDRNDRMTSNISSLRVLKDTLEEVTIKSCRNVAGNFMDLADFPHLKTLNLIETAVTGDIHDIAERDFPSLEQLNLPKGVYGGNGYEFQRISDAPDVARAIYIFKKQRPTLEMEEYWCGVLSEDSPDWYEYTDEPFVAIDDTPPLYIRFVEAGSRIGYRWESDYGIPCEVNWLDPEPDRQSSDYDEYIEELQEIEHQVTMYRGFIQPPTEEEYNRLERRLMEEGRWWSDDDSEEEDEESDSESET